MFGKKKVPTDMKLFNMHFSPFFRHLLPLRYKYSSEHPALDWPTSLSYTCSSSCYTSASFCNLMMSIVVKLCYLLDKLKNEITLYLRVLMHWQLNLW